MLLWLQTSFSIGLDADKALYCLLKHEFPADKWRALANGLGLATAVRTIEADCGDVDSQLQGLIVHWLANDPGATWQKLVSAVYMCKEKLIADKLAKDVSSHCLWLLLLDAD